MDIRSERGQRRLRFVILIATWPFLLWYLVTSTGDQGGVPFLFVAAAWAGFSVGFIAGEISGMARREGLPALVGGIMGVGMGALIIVAHFEEAGGATPLGIWGWLLGFGYGFLVGVMGHLALALAIDRVGTSTKTRAGVDG